MTLVIMAAGIGSRFGGLKQIEPVGPNGEYIIDYSVYDAIKNGFDKIVFIIKKENENIFKETIGKRIERFVKVEYVYQEFDNLPKKVNIIREKPWGTAQAIYCTRNVVKDNFAVINSDDFYGEDCFKLLNKFLSKNKDRDFGLVGYHLKNTMPKTGCVKRGVCKAQDSAITDIIESSVEQYNGCYLAKPLSGETEFKTSGETWVSMNALAFTPRLFEYLPSEFDKFIDKVKDLTKDEFLIPEVLRSLILENKINLHLLKTKAKWCGMTYKEDKTEVVEMIKDLINNGEYPANLWNLNNTNTIN
jgi:NDP-sugar pyrophosphorylase family protein